MDATTPTTTAAETLRRLDPAELRQRLIDLAAEREAIRVLLRSVDARERSRKPGRAADETPPPPG